MKRLQKTGAIYSTGAYISLRCSMRLSLNTLILVFLDSRHRKTNFRYYLEIVTSSLVRETTWRPRFLSHNNFTFSRKFLTTESVVFKSSDPWKNSNVSLSVSSSSFVWVPTSARPPFFSWKTKWDGRVKTWWQICFTSDSLKGHHM